MTQPERGWREKKGGERERERERGRERDRERETEREKLDNISCKEGVTNQEPVFSS